MYFGTARYDACRNPKVEGITRTALLRLSLQPISVLAVAVLIIHFARGTQSTRLSNTHRCRPPGSTPAPPPGAAGWLSPASSRTKWMCDFFMLPPFRFVRPSCPPVLLSRPKSRRSCTTTDKLLDPTWGLVPPAAYPTLCTNWHTHTHPYTRTSNAHTRARTSHAQNLLPSLAVLRAP